METIKAFISYSWSSTEHEEWVLQLATDLRESGIDAILDKWDLKEGHETNAFMEKMVSDENIAKVIIVSDRMYAQKSDSRKGGAGTEAQIISRELFQGQDQNKFVAVVTELDDKRNPCLPKYYTSRIYIDFTDPAKYSEKFEQLLRWIVDKPIYKKPGLGKLPTYISDAENTISLSTNSYKRTAYDAITKHKEHAYPVTKDYFELFISELEKFRLDVSIDPLSDEFLSNFQSFIPYRDECLDVIGVICRYTNDQRFSDLVHDFFERFLEFYYAPEGMESYREYSFDNYKFFGQELFLHCGSLFVSEERHDLFNALLQNNYYIERQANIGNDPLIKFTEFQKYIKLLEYRKTKSSSHRTPIIADMLKERVAGSGTDFRKIMQTEFLFFLRSELANPDTYDRWRPQTLGYLGLHFRPFEIFERSRSSRYFERIRPFLGNATKTDLEQFLTNFGQSRFPLIEGFRIPHPTALIGIQNLCTTP